jgi:hypothetical protein
MAFDPCRDWLGIAAVDLADPRKVLGLPPGVLIPDAVSTAAAARLEALRQVKPGPFAKAHAALVNRVQEARNQLLGEAMAAAPPQPPPPFAPRLTPEPVPVSLERDDQPSAAALELPPVPIVARRTTAPRRPRSSAGGALLLGSIALLTAAVAVLAFAVSQGWTSGRQVATKPPVKGNTVPPAPPAPPTTGQQPPERPAPAPVKPTPEPPMANNPNPAGQREAEERAERARKQAADKARQQEAVRTAERQAAEKKAAEEKAAETQGQAAAEMQAKLAEAVEQSLREAYKAIQRAEFDTAKRAIASAGKQAGDDVEQATRVERWNLFATYAQAFLKFRDQALAAANAGREYDVDGTKFAVVEVTPDTFIYRLAGKNVRVPRDEMNPRMMMAIVETWFAADGRAANHLFLGAHWLALAPPDTRRARAEWRIAGGGGENVAPLMTLLDDPVIRRAGR